MTRPPANPKIYHITPVDNLASIIAGGGLSSDAAISQRGGPATSIGMRSIKQARLRLPVRCYPGDFVGDYVPFYYCPRSIMLYVIHRANLPGLTYRGGQGPIIHLEADLHEVIAWADQNGTRWAFSLSNAGAAYAEFRKRADQLDQINWRAVASTDFRSVDVKEGKQAEFLVRQFFPWDLVRRIGVRSPDIKQQVDAVLQNTEHRPSVEIRTNWYY